MALATEPTNVMALSVLAGLGVKDDAFILSCRAAADAHPDDVPALLLLSGMLTGPERAKERRGLLEKAVRIAPEDPEVLNVLAWEDVLAGNGRKALAIAQKAVDLAPDRAKILDTLAAALAQSERCADALEAQRRAVKLAFDDGRSGGLQKRLAAYEAGCKSVPTD